MAQSLLIKKLRIQPGQRILILNAPPGYAESLGELPEDVVVSEEPAGEFDFVHLFVVDSAEFARMARQRSVLSNTMGCYGSPIRSGARRSRRIAPVTSCGS